MMRLALAALLAVALVSPEPAQPARPIRVAADFRQTVEQRRDAGVSHRGPFSARPGSSPWLTTGPRRC